MNKQKGFTLIELLVVIAIIGLLSTLAVISLNSARAKARDAQRLSDTKQMSTILETEDANSPSANVLDATIPGNCAAAALTSTCDGPGDISQFSRFTDPVGTVACVGLVTGGGTASAATCGYSISNAAGTGVALTSDYQLCFWLEASTSNLTAGLHAIKNGGAFGTCN